MIGIVVFFNSVYKHGFCKHWQYKKLSNLFQYWKIRCVQLSSFSLSGGYMGTCPFQSLSIKSPVQREKKGNSKVLKCHERGWWKWFFSSWKGKISTEGTLPLKNSFPDFLQTSLQLLQGELAVKPRAEFNKAGTESYSGAAAALPFLADRIAFFLTISFSPFLSFSGISM